MSRRATNVRSTRGTRYVWIGIAVAAVIVGGVYFYSGSGSGKSPARPAPAPPALPPSPSVPVPQRGGAPMPGVPLGGGRMMAVVDLNTASESQLMTLPGMTPDFAKKILAGRP